MTDEETLQQWLDAHDPRLILEVVKLRSDVSRLETTIGFNARDPLGQRVHALQNELESLRAVLRAKSAVIEELEAEAEQRSAVADDLAIALHHCSTFLPLFLSEHGEEGRKLQRALAVHEQVDIAMKAYCDLTGTHRPDLTNRTATTTKETP